MLNLTIFASKLNRLEWIGLRENAQKKLWILTPTWGFLEILSSSNSRINMPFSGIPVSVDNKEIWALGWPKFNTNSGCWMTSKSVLDMCLKPTYVEMQLRLQMNLTKAPVVGIL